MANNTRQYNKNKKFKKMPILCKGCLKEFCQTDFNEHKQLLNKELNFIMNDYDQFRQRINEQKENSQKSHLSIQLIDQWELKSIGIIQQTAEKCRLKVIEYSNKYFEEIEQKLSEQIKEIQRENDFNEIDLKNFKEKLNQINEELNNPSNISIKKYRQGFINKISVNSKTRFNNLTTTVLSGLQKESKFQQHGIIVAGGNERGNELNQLSSPCGISVDENQTIFIADVYNHRIVEWKSGKTEGHIIVGGNGLGNRRDRLNHPIDVIIDQQNHSIIIADKGNRRVMRWSQDEKLEILIENISCNRLAMDQYGFLYVSDIEKNEVRKWNIEEINENDEGILVTGAGGGNGNGNQLRCPDSIFVDKDQSVYVSDKDNHRVMKWKKDAREGLVVAGGNGQGFNLNQLHCPTALFVDEWNQLYVMDCLNHRIMRWCEGDREGSIVVNGIGQGSESNQFRYSFDLSFDFEGNLYVSDCWNHRIVRFDRIY